MYRNFSIMFLSFIVLVIFLPATVTAQDATPKDGVDFYFDIYAVLPNIYMDSASESESEIDLGTIIDDLQFMAMVVVGAKKDKWGIQADVIYFDIEDDNSSTKNLPHLPWRPTRSVNVKTDVEMKAWVVTPTVSYTVLERDNFKLDLLAGARYLYLDIDLKVDIDGIRDHERSKSGSDSGHVWDGIVGLRGEVTLNERWYMPLYADIGTGDSDLTYNLFGGFGYRFSRVDLIAGWRYLRWNLDDNPVFDDLYLSGPLVGVKFRF